MASFPYQPLNPPVRTLLGAGPCNIHPRVQMAMAAPMVGHLDPYFQLIMDDNMALLRHVFQTKNKLTFPISGTGSAGLEASFDNFLEPGDVAVIGVNGVFGERMADNAARTGARVVPVTAEWGKIIEPEAMAAALNKEKKVKLVSVVHCETSTGILQPVEEISKLAKEHDALFLLDTVTSLGAHEVQVDKWGVDISFSCTQKGLGCPPGLSPFTANEKALAVMAKRKEKCHSWYLDLSLLSSYWATGRVYHHTAPISMNYALHEALALIAEEGLEARNQRHVKHGRALQAGLEAMGLVLHAQKGYRSCSLTTVQTPQGIDGGKVLQRLLKEYNIEISGGLGPLKGKILRIGLMAHSSTRENVFLILNTLESILIEEGYKPDVGAAVNAAIKCLAG